MVVSDKQKRKTAHGGWRSNAAAAGDGSFPAMNKDAFSGMGEEIPYDEEVPC